MERRTDEVAPQRRAIALAGAAAEPPSLHALRIHPALDADAQGLLRELDLRTRGRWQRLAALTTEDAGEPLRQWLLPPEAASRARLRLDRDGLRWTEPDGSRWFAPLGADAVRSLQALAASR